MAKGAECLDSRDVARYCERVAGDSSVGDLFGGIGDEGHMDIETETAVATAAATIVAAYVRRQSVAPGEVAPLLTRVMSVLAFREEAAPATQQPAVSLRRLIRPDTVVCAECGWTGKSMRRHLAAGHGLSPEAYRAKWGLSPDHPMISPAYAARRAELARSFGLGARGATASKARKRRG